jgi:hypothetical protein
MRRPPVLLLATVLAAGCGGSGEATTPTTAAALAVDEIDVDASPYCAAWAEIRATGSPPSLSAVRLREHYTNLVPVAERVLATSPEEVREANEVALDAIRRVAATGDAAVFAEPGVRAARNDLAGYAARECRKR